MNALLAIVASAVAETPNRTPVIVPVFAVTFNVVALIPMEFRTNAGDRTRIAYGDRSRVNAVPLQTACDRSGIVEIERRCRNAIEA